MRSQGSIHWISLLKASSDLVILLVRGRIVHVSPGGTAWSGLEQLHQQPLDTLFPDDLANSLQTVIDKVLAVPGTVESLEYVWRPEHLPKLRELGLREPCWFEANFVATGQGIVIWSARDVTEKRNLQRKVSNQAQRDPITGAYNRRALMVVMEQTVAQAQRYDWTCSVLLIDIDDFSGINERFSWDAGDQILQEIVNSMHRLKRTSDFLARYGDDRLVLFVPETNLDQAVAAGERYRRLIQGLEIPYPTGELRCTASVGVATLRDVEDSAADMLRRAEENLQVARLSGGNRVEGEGG